jgi:hypothetical protein
MKRCGLTNNDNKNETPEKKATLAHMQPNHTKKWVGYVIYICAL